MTTYRTRRPPPRRRNGCLVGLVTLIWIVLALVLGYQYFLRGRISQEIGSQIGQQVAPSPTERAQAGADQREARLPTAVAALPNGQIVITEAQANEFLSSNSAELAPLERLQVRFVPGEIQADLSAYGISSTAYTGLAIQGGRIVTVQPRIEGPLAAAIDLHSLVDPLESRLNELLAEQGRRISDVRIDQGQLVFTVE
jgi:hypothetical protein